MDFVPAIKSGFKNSFKYEGRASRSEFWWFYLFSILALIGLFVLGAIVIGVTSNGSSQGGSSVAGGIFGMLFILYFIATFFPTLSLIVRRLHDSDKSGWFILLAFVPFGGIVLLVFYCLAGTIGPNRYGEDPLRRPASVANMF